MASLLMGVVGATAIVSLPLYLVAAQAVESRSSLHFSPAQLGIVVASYYTGSATFAFAGGNAAELIGGLRLLRYSIVLSAGVLVTVAALIGSWPTLAAVLFVAGAASTAGQASSNLVLSLRIMTKRQGLAFGIKQAAVPLAFLIAGAAVPAVALSIGWRWAFVGGGALACLALLGVPRPKSSLSDRVGAGRQNWDPERSRPLVVLAIGFG